ncbi:phage minor capsid protein [Anaeromassilibacillus senegalensis]|uniref:phage minor capsid protein n=1 Tax=Anaeromassilibacillus senegalensis TaxID=1673717 RepID=UPI0006832D02|nr:phage minor capsid protein [Anaeromassilibacillus senegalensis]
MLKPKYLEQLPDAMIELYSEVETDLLEEMARRIAKCDYWTPATDWQYRKLIEMGNYHSYVIEALAARTGKTTEELKRLMMEAGQESIKFDASIYREQGLDPPPLAASEAMRKTLETGYKWTQGLFVNLTRTTAATATGQLEHALDKAYLTVSTGAMDYNTAIRRAVKELARQGIGAVTYPSGHRDNIEVAVRRAVLTGVNQTALQLQMDLADEMECDLVETTAHAGARPEHAAWQGQVYSRSGKSSKYPDFVRSTGYGSGAGLGGWNCRHSFYPYYDGSVRTYSKADLADYDSKKYRYNGKAMTEYEASQQQRYIERQVRRWKREYAAMDAAGQDTYESAAKIKQWQNAQKDFVRQTGLKRQAAREQIAKYGQSQAAQSRVALDKYAKYRYNKNGTIIPTDDWTDRPHQSIPKTYRPNAVVDTVSRKGKQRDRVIYDADGKMVTQIHGGDHGTPKRHPYGNHGEHIHDYAWPDDNGKPTKTTRELTQAEKEAHKDLFEEG